MLQEARHRWIFMKYNDRLFDDLKNYVMFIGYAHSGHSVVET